MRWLTVTVAGYTTRWRVLLVGLMGACGLAQAQTIEISAPKTSAPSDSNRTVALVEVVTESHQASEADPSASTNAPASAVQVTVVTESNQSQDPDPSPSRRRKKMSVAQVTVVTESTQINESAAPLPPSEFNPDPGATLNEPELEAA